MSRIWVACLLWVAVMASSAAEKKLRVLTTFLPGYSFAASVAGDRALVENLVPGNVSLHDFQLSPPELRKLASADVIIVNGLGLETFLEKAIKTSGSKATIVSLSAGLEAQLIHEDAPAHERSEHGHDHSHDPHIWLDPTLAAHGVSNVVAGLVRADSKNAEAYRANAEAYQNKLRALDGELKAKLAPISGAGFITYHNAFRYFARRYGLNLVGVVEQVPEIPPSPRERRELSNAIRTKKVKALFSEPGGGTRLAKQIAQDEKIVLGELDPLEMGDLAPDSYERGMRKNVEALVKVLQ